MGLDTFPMRRVADFARAYSLLAHYFFLINCMGASYDNGDICCTDAFTGFFYEYSLFAHYFFG